MNNEEIDYFIKLLNKWKNNSLNWGECCELREYKYEFGDAIEKYYQEWGRG